MTELHACWSKTQPDASTEKSSLCLARNTMPHTETITQPCSKYNVQLEIITLPCSKHNDSHRYYHPALLEIQRPLGNHHSALLETQRPLRKYHSACLETQRPLRNYLPALLEIQRQLTSPSLARNTTPHTETITQPCSIHNASHRRDHNAFQSSRKWGQRLCHNRVCRIFPLALGLFVSSSDLQS